jgi:hypothetical protein
LLLELNKQSVQDFVVYNPRFAEILVKDIGLANLKSLTKLTITEGYRFMINNVIEYLASENALNLKVLFLSEKGLDDKNYIRILQQVQKLAL